MTTMEFLSKFFILLMAFHSGCFVVHGDEPKVNDKSLKVLIAELKLAKVKIFVSEEQKFRFLVAGSKIYDYEVEYSLKESKEILKKLQKLKTAEVEFSIFFHLREDAIIKEEKDLIRLIEGYKFDKVIFTRATGHGTPHLIKYYKRRNR